METYELKIGEKANFTKTIGEFDIYSFAGITGDFNPAHIDDLSAKNTRFNSRIAHGMISAGLISSVIGMKLPGPGTIYLKQEIEFLAPVYIGDTITASAEIHSIDDVKNRVILKTICVNQDDKEVVRGFATVIPPLK